MTLYDESEEILQCNFSNHSDLQSGSSESNHIHKVRRNSAAEHHFVGHVGYVVFALFNLLSDSANESEGLYVDNEENALLP